MGERHWDPPWYWAWKWDAGSTICEYWAGSWECAARSNPQASKSGAYDHDIINYKEQKYNAQSLTENIILYHRCSAYGRSAYGCFLIWLYRSAWIGHNYEKIAGNIQSQGRCRWKKNFAGQKLDIKKRKWQEISKIKDNVGEKGIEFDENWT